MIVVCDSRLPIQYKKALEAEIPGLFWLPLQIDKDNSVYQSIRNHPDIYFLQLSSRECIYAPCVPEDVLEALKNQRIRLVPGTSNPYSEHPNTACYNAVCLDNFLIHNIAYTNETMINEVTNRGIEIIKVEQGYTRCSSVPVGKQAIITADLGIAEAVREKGIDVLTISPGNVILPGEKYGFLGGATGILPDGTIVFVGDVNTHPDVSAIINFLQKHKINYLDLVRLPLYDCGTLLFFHTP